MTRGGSGWWCEDRRRTGACWGGPARAGCAWQRRRRSVDDELVDSGHGVLRRGCLRVRHDLRGRWVGGIGLWSFYGEEFERRPCGGVELKSVAPVS